MITISTRSVTASNQEGAAAAEAELVADASGLVTPPSVCVKLFDLVRSERASAAEIGDVVASDPNLTARVLRIVNSSFYGFPSEVATISRAVTILGINDLNNLVLAISAVRAFSSFAAGLVPIETFWRHSIFCGLVARCLAKQLGAPEPDRLFVAGLLHDVGITILYGQRPNTACRLLGAAREGEDSLYAAERGLLGFTHASVGALLLDSWQLPGALGAAIRHHHDPCSADSGRVEAALVHLADAVSNRSGGGELWASPTSRFDPGHALGDALGVAPESLDLEQALRAAHAGLAETVRSLAPTPLTHGGG